MSAGFGLAKKGSCAKYGRRFLNLGMRHAFRTCLCNRATNAAGRGSSFLRFSTGRPRWSRCSGSLVGGRVRSGKWLRVSMPAKICLRWYRTGFCISVSGWGRTRWRISKAYFARAFYNRGYFNSGSTSLNRASALYNLLDTYFLNCGIAKAMPRKVSYVSFFG